MHTHKQCLGILGGGQLGLMLAEAAKGLDVDVAVWAPQGDNPAMRLADHRIEAPFLDSDATALFASLVDAVTLEFENVPVECLRALEFFDVPVRPSSKVLDVAQDRLKEKEFFSRIGVPTTQFVPVAAWCVNSAIEMGMWRDFPYPAILKTVRDGYDGKGQVIVRSPSEVYPAWESLGKKDCILEAWVDFAYEVSVTVMRDVQGRTMNYEPVENEHRDGILRVSQCPGPRITAAAARLAIEYARNVAEELGLVGILTLETLVTRNDRVLANEIAPRPHNSGHGTIEACSISQFTQLTRIALGQLAVAPKLLHSWRMENLIGPESIERLAELATDSEAHVHNYGKQGARPGRKMGHVTWIRELAAVT